MELRWILLITGLAIIGIVYWSSLRDSRRSGNPSPSNQPSGDQPFSHPSVKSDTAPPASTALPETLAETLSQLPDDPVPDYSVSNALTDQPGTWSDQINHEMQGKLPEVAPPETVLPGHTTEIKHDGEVLSSLVIEGPLPEADIDELDPSSLDESATGSAETDAPYIIEDSVFDRLMHNVADLTDKSQSIKDYTENRLNHLKQTSTQQLDNLQKRSVSLGKTTLKKVAKTAAEKGTSLKRTAQKTMEDRKQRALRTAELRTAELRTAELQAAQQKPDVLDTKQQPEADTDLLISPSTADAPTASTVDKRQYSLIVAEDLVIFHLLSMGRGGRFDGNHLLRELVRADLIFGEQDVYHYYHDDEKVFSVANMLKPGTFNPHRPEQAETQGVSIFMQLKDADHPVKNFETMLRVSGLLSQRLDGRLYDAHREPLTQQAMGFLYDEVKQYQYTR